MDDKSGRFPLLALGFMCGTSLDGIDGSLISVEEGEIHLLAFGESPFSPTFRKEIKNWMSGRDTLGDPSRYMPDLANLLSMTEVRLAETLLSKARISPDRLCGVGTHGVTLRHQPEKHPVFFLNGQPTIEGVSFQFSNPFPLARSLGVPVVSQFRGSDLAAGGCGAPLAPTLHRALFTTDEPRVFLNIGGIANMTFLPAARSAQAITAFDTGPGNMLLDLALHTLSDGTQLFDAEGLRAKQGTVIRPLLQRLLSDPYFSRRPPKSTGREEWGEERLNTIFEWMRSQGQNPHERVEDLLATLVELTAEGIRLGLGHLPAPPSRIITAGGGIRNLTLMDRIRALTNLPVHDSGTYGFPPQSIESVAFAYLALLSLSGRPGALRTVTGAEENTVLGQITPPPCGLSPDWLQDVSMRADIHLPFPDRPKKHG